VETNTNTLREPATNEVSSVTLLAASLCERGNRQARDILGRIDVGKSCGRWKGRLRQAHVRAIPFFCRGVEVHFAVESGEKPSPFICCG
jgi:hypothetical protein